MKRLISKTFQIFSKWKVHHTVDLPQKCVVIGAPHTSNWDGIFMVVVMWDLKRNFQFLVKDSLLKGWLAPLVRWVGGIGVDRNSHHGLVADVAAQARAAEEFTLVIAPEGTRSKRDYWKSGFYHIAREADLPVVLATIDRRSHTIGFNKIIRLSGDITADMDVIRAHYDGAQGVKPGNVTPPRFRVEDEDATDGKA